MTEYAQDDHLFQNSTTSLWAENVASNNLFYTQFLLYLMRIKQICIKLAKSFTYCISTDYKLKSCVCLISNLNHLRTEKCILCIETPIYSITSINSYLSENL